MINKRFWPYFRRTSRKTIKIIVNKNIILYITNKRTKKCLKFLLNIYTKKEVVKKIFEMHHFMVDYI